MRIGVRESMRERIPWALFKWRQLGVHIHGYLKIQFGNSCFEPCWPWPIKRQLDIGCLEEVHIVNPKINGALKRN